MVKAGGNPSASNQGKKRVQKREKSRQRPTEKEAIDEITKRKRTDKEGHQKREGWVEKKEGSSPEKLSYQQCRRQPKGRELTGANCR